MVDNLLVLKEFTKNVTKHCLIVNELSVAFFIAKNNKRGIFVAAFELKIFPSSLEIKQEMKSTTQSFLQELVVVVWMVFS